MKSASLFYCFRHEFDAFYNQMTGFQRECNDSVSDLRQKTAPLMTLLREWREAREISQKKASADLIGALSVKIELLVDNGEFWDIFLLLRESKMTFQQLNLPNNILAAISDFIFGLFGRPDSTLDHLDGWMQFLDFQPFDSIRPFCIKTYCSLLLSEFLKSSRVFDEENECICVSDSTSQMLKKSFNFAQKKCVELRVFLSEKSVSDIGAILLQNFERLHDEAIDDFVASKPPFAQQSILELDNFCHELHLIIKSINCFLAEKSFEGVNTKFYTEKIVCLQKTYASYEKRYIDEAFSMAIKENAFEADKKIISSVEDVFYVVKKVSKRAIVLGDADTVEDVIGHLISAVKDRYFYGFLEERCLAGMVLGMSDDLQGHRYSYQVYCNAIIAASEYLCKIQEYFCINNENYASAVLNSVFSKFFSKLHSFLQQIQQKYNEKYFIICYKQPLSIILQDCFKIANNFVFTASKSDFDQFEFADVLIQRISQLIFNDFNMYSAESNSNWMRERCLKAFVAAFEKFLYFNESTTSLLPRYSDLAVLFMERQLRDIQLFFLEHLSYTLVQSHFSKIHLAFSVLNADSVSLYLCSSLIPILLARRSLFFD